MRIRSATIRYWCVRKKADPQESDKVVATTTRRASLQVLRLSRDLVHRAYDASCMHQFLGRVLAIETCDSGSRAQDSVRRHGSSDHGRSPDRTRIQHSAARQRICYSTPVVSELYNSGTRKKASEPRRLRAAKDRAIDGPEVEATAVSARRRPRTPRKRRAWRDMRRGSSRARDVPPVLG